MSPYPTAAADGPTDEVEPLRCFCGASAFDCSFVRFPMTHVARCRNCGLEQRCGLKITPAGPGSPKPLAPPMEMPPFWY